MRGDRLRKVREAQQYTQDELAEKLGVAVLQIWRWESGKNEPSGEIVAQFAQILNVSTDYLLGVSDVPSPVNSELSMEERRVLTAMRNGDKLEAIRVIAGG